MAEMKTLTIGETAYEIVDEKARNEKLDASKLPSAINTALAQAKASGEFDGAAGTSPTVSVIKFGKVTTISITDKNGTKTATINDGADGGSLSDEQIAQAVSDYMAENPVEVPDVDLTGYVKTVNGNAPDKNGNVTVESGGTVSDEHINSLIDAKLGVIENGTY